MKLSVLALIALLVAGPVLADELDDSLAALKEAQSKKDLAAIKKLAAETSELAKEQAEMEEPADASLKEAWKARSAWAKDVVKFADYALYSTALGAEPDVAIEVLTALEAQNPKSQYLDEGGYQVYFAALTKKGEASKIPAIAQKALASLPNSMDLLLVLADDAMGKGQTGQGSTYAQRLISAAGKAQKPEGMSDADWNQKKGLALGRGYYYTGMVQAQGQNYFQADKSLRAALPYIKGSGQMYGMALFQLGVANFTLGAQTNNKKRVLEAISLTEQASKIAGPHTQQAVANITAMRAQAAKMQ